MKAQSRSKMQSALRHKGVRWIALGWAGFITENVVLSHNREWIITEFGKDTYMRAYAGLSSIANLSILYGYFRHGRRQGPTFPSVRRKVGLVTGGTTTLATALESAARKARASGPRLAAAVVLQAVGLGMMLQLAPKFQVPVEFRARAERLPILEAGASEEQSALVQGPQLPSSQQPSEGGITLRCPFDFSDRSQSQSGDGDEELYTGVHRISRHPGLWGLGLFGLGSAILTPFVAEALFFGMPCVFALIGGAHQVRFMFSLAMARVVPTFSALLLDTYSRLEHV